MLTITKEFHFSASHVLEGLSSWRPCARMHGHNYVVILELSAPKERLVPPGFVHDYRDLDKFKQWIDKTLDHRHSNETTGGGGTVSGEPGDVDLRPVVRRVPRTHSRENLRNPKTTAEYRPPRTP